MIKNWKIIAYMASPLCGEAPNLEALLTWELARRLGKTHRDKITKATALCNIEMMPIPITKKTMAGFNIDCCSSPILPVPSAEWQERIAKRFDTTRNSMILKEKQRRTLSQKSGHYKQRFAPVQLQLVDRVVWFVRGDRKQIHKLLKSIFSIGKCRRAGYGLIDFWDYEETKQNNSIVADNVLMRIVPAQVVVESPRIDGYSLQYGAWTHPYWHPENYMEVARPC